MKNITTVKAISHAKENLSIIIEGKDVAAIIAEVQTHEGVKAPGKVSLKEMLEGTKTKVGDWEVIDLEVTPEPNKAKGAAAAAAKANAEADKKAPESAAKNPADPEADKKAADAKTKTVTLTPEQAKLAADAEKKLPTKETKPVVEKPPRVLKDVSHLLPTPGEYRSIKEGSTTFKLFTDMCGPDGITKKAACEKYGWSDGGWGGIIHWEPKHKGYKLGVVKVDGVAHYHLMWHDADTKEGRTGGNVKVKAEEIAKTEPKPVVAKKTDEEKAAAAKEKADKKAAEAKEKADKKAQAAADKAAAAAAKPAPAPKAAADAPQGGGNVTRRSRKTKDAAAAAAPAA